MAGLTVDPKHAHPHPRSPSTLPGVAKGTLQMQLRLRSKEREGERLPWIIWVGPILPLESLKMEKGCRRKGQRHVMMEEAVEI